MNEARVFFWLIEAVIVICAYQAMMHPSKDHQNFWGWCGLGLLLWTIAQAIGII